MKKCNECNELKSTEEFYEGRRQCKSCISEIRKKTLTEDQIVKQKENSKKWRESNKDKVKAYAKERYAKVKELRPTKIPKIPTTYMDFSPEKKKEIGERMLKRAEANLPRYLWERAKARSKIRGIEFNIEVSDIVIPDICPVLLIPIQKNRGIKDNSISLDRIDPTKGYIVGNIMVISYLANAMKRDADIETLKTFANWILNTLSTELFPTSQRQYQSRINPSETS